MLVFQRRAVEVVEFVVPYRVNLPAAESCEIKMGGETVEVVKEFNYLVSVSGKHGEMDGENRTRAVKGKSAIGAFGRIMNGRSVSMDVMSGFRNSILLLTLTYR